MTFARRALGFFKALEFPAALPKDIEVMNPYRNAETFGYVETFFEKFYNDERERITLWGINPGRHGGGLTGLPFTTRSRSKKFSALNTL